MGGDDHPQYLLAKNTLILFVNILMKCVQDISLITSVEVSIHEKAVFFDSAKYVII